MNDQRHDRARPDETDADADAQARARRRHEAGSDADGEESAMDRADRANGEPDAREPGA